MKEPEYLPEVTGKIIYINAEKGWGFINTHDIQFSKVYFHWTGLVSSLNFKSLKKNDTVKFKAIKREKGWKAINVEAVPDATESK